MYRRRLFILMVLMFILTTLYWSCNIEASENFKYVDTIENHKYSVDRNYSVVRVECLVEPYTYYIEKDTVGFEKCPSCEQDVQLMENFNSIVDNETHIYIKIVLGFIYGALISAVPLILYFNLRDVPRTESKYVK